GRLALDCVPGMKVVEVLPASHRPSETWGLELARRICGEVDAIREAHKRGRKLLGVKPAIDLLKTSDPDSWGQYKTTTLKTRYYEQIKLQKRIAELPPIESLWKFNELTAKRPAKRK